MRRANCILFAVALWLRRYRRGSAAHESYLVIRLSRVPWGVCHVLHGKLDHTTNQLKLVSYKPHAAKKRGLEPVFAGRVERGDKPYAAHRIAD
jgi:hypothetical protein